MRCCHTYEVWHQWKFLDTLQIQNSLFNLSIYEPVLGAAGSPNTGMTFGAVMTRQNDQFPFLRTALR